IGKNFSENKDDISRLKGKLIEKRRKEDNVDAVLDQRALEKKIKIPGTKFQSDEWVYKVLNYKDGKTFVHLSVEKRDGTGSPFIENISLTKIWGYYQEKRIEFI
ncbi:MAG: hypothetical protein WCJ51_03320, partial [Candidatus Moraniibacteriota bacterium]